MPQYAHKIAATEVTLTHGQSLWYVTVPRTAFPSAEAVKKVPVQKVPQVAQHPGQCSRGEPMGTGVCSNPHEVVRFAW
eukprot:573403-Amphidinium_carterae.1